MFERLQEVVEQGIEKKLHLGVQVSFSFQGKSKELAYGNYRDGIPLEVDDQLLWLSACKPIAAVVLMILQQRGSLSIDDPVAKHLSEFVGEGKEHITIQHFLTHTAGLEDIPFGWTEDEQSVVIERLCGAKIQKDWVPGQRAAYVPGASWFLLGEIISRASGAPFPEFIQNEILNPLGMTKTVCVYRECTDEIANDLQMYDRIAGELQKSLYVDRLRKGVVSPGSCFVGPACDLRQFYDALRSCKKNEAEQQQILSVESMEQMTFRHREGLYDETFRHKVDVGLGVIVNSQKYGAGTVPYGYGDRCSEETFGHGGSQCSIGFADPMRELSMVIVANGRPGEGRHQRRIRQMIAAIEEDLQEL